MNIVKLSIEEKRRLENVRMKLSDLCSWFRATPNWTLLYDAAKVDAIDAMLGGIALCSGKEMMGILEFLKKEFDKIVLPKEEKLNSVMSELINRFGLKDEDQIAEKIQQLMDSELNNQFVQKLIDIINSYYPGQVSDSSSALIFVSEIIKQIESMRNIQTNTNTLCVNIDALIAENVNLKAMVASLTAENNRLKSNN